MNKVKKIMKRFDELKIEVMDLFILALLDRIRQIGTSF